MPSLSYEWLLIPAVGTSLWATFIARAAVTRGIKVAPLALLSLTFSFLAVGIALLVNTGTRGLWPWRLDTVWIATLGGMGGAAGLCFNYAALRQRATGPVTTIAAMSVLVPIAMGLLLGWDARPGLPTLVGAALTLAGTLAINIGKAPRLEAERVHWLRLALGAMLCFGISQAAQKYITVAQPQSGHAPRYTFMAGYYFAAAVGLGAYLLATRQRPEWRACPFAFALAMGSVTQFVCMLVLLQHANTALVYVTFTGGGVVLILLVSAGILGERYRPLVWVGCLLGVCGVVLMRLGSVKPPEVPEPPTPPRVHAAPDAPR